MYNSTLATFLVESGVQNEPDELSSPR